MTANGIASMLNNYNEIYVNKKLSKHPSLDINQSVSNSVLEKIADDSTHYLHIILSSGVDQASRAALKDVLEL